MKNSAGEVGDGLDVKGDGGYIVAPPSMHFSGKHYQWAAGGPGVAIVADAPAWLLDRVAKRNAPEKHEAASDISASAKAVGPEYARKALAEECATVASTKPSHRRKTLNASALKIGGLVKAGLLDEQEARDKLTEAAHRMGEPLGEDEILKTIDDALRDANPRGLSLEVKAEHRADDQYFPATDQGNAEMMVHRHGADLPFCHSYGRWLTWDGRRWAVDETGEVRRRMAETIRKGRLLQVMAEEDPDKRRELLRFVRASESEPKLHGAVKLAEKEKAVAITAADLDSDDFLLNCLNGTIDLRTGERRPHNRADLISKLAPAL